MGTNQRVVVGNAMLIMCKWGYIKLATLSSTSCNVLANHREVEFLYHRLGINVSRLSSGGTTNLDEKMM